MKILVILLLLIIPTKNSFSKDFSSLGVDLGTYDSNGAFSMNTNAHFMITDPMGRVTGQNPFIGEDKGEIPNSGYSIESLGELKEGGDSATEGDVLPGPESASFEMGPMQAAGVYNMQIFGIRDTKYALEIMISDRNNKSTSLKFESYLSSGAINSLDVNIDPTPGAPAPVLTKTVTFDVLRNDVSVAQKLNQLGNDKFTNSLVKNINLAEKLPGVCDKRKSKKDKCEPAIAVLKLFIKRLEKANRKCDSKNPHACDEDNDWNDFDKEHRKDHDYDDFFEDWDKDDWQKDKKKCKRFITDEALKIIREDAQWLIKSLSSDSTQISLSPDQRMPANPARA